MVHPPQWRIAGQGRAERLRAARHHRPATPIPTGSFLARSSCPCLAVDFLAPHAESGPGHSISHRQHADWRVSRIGSLRPPLPLSPSHSVRPEPVEGPGVSPSRRKPGSRGAGPFALREIEACPEALEGGEREAAGPSVVGSPLRPTPAKLPHHRLQPV